jgi:hypothetical protein
MIFAGAIEIEDLKKIAADMMENWTADQLQVHIITLVNRGLTRLSFLFLAKFAEGGQASAANLDNDADPSLCSHQAMLDEADASGKGKVTLDDFQQLLQRAGLA